ncbi:MAG: hypothetical protein WEA77_08850 [Hyphomonas sp.]|uniref:hypothetical protein n=1 Tax=Hyphomonas sp. TaxID=87 RepID=UPI0034A0030D
MRQLNQSEFLRIMWPHLPCVVFMVAVNAYYLTCIMPGLPSEPDPAKGYKTRIEVNQETAYISAPELTLLFGSILLGMLAALFGFRRLHGAQKALRISNASSANEARRLPADAHHLPADAHGAGRRHHNASGAA